jgi:hypothetical protein
MPKTLKDSEQFTYSLSEADAKGAAIDNGDITFDEPPVWTSSNPAVAPLTVAPDGKTAQVVAGVPGVATVSVSAAIGGQAFAGQDDVTVTVGAAAKIALVAGDTSSQ